MANCAYLRQSGVDVHLARCLRDGQATNRHNFFLEIKGSKQTKPPRATRVIGRRRPPTRQTAAAEQQSWRLRAPASLHAQF